MAAKFLYRSYRWFYTVGNWRRRHFTPAGFLILVFLFFSGLFGFNILRTNIYQLMVLCGSIMAVSFFFSLYPLRVKIKIKRILPDYTSVKSSASYEIEITNRTSKTQKGLILFEEIRDPRPSHDMLMTKKEPFEHLRNAWDRKTLYYRWLWLVKKRGKAGFAPIQLPDLLPNEAIRVTLKFRPWYRGYIHFKGFTLARPDPLGLFNRLYVEKKAQKLLVLPVQYRLDPPDLISTRKFHPGGVSLASSIGDSDEFMSLRQYRPGDPLRNVHWRTFAKTNELVIKEFEDEYFVRHALLLDTFCEPDNAFLFEEAVSVAASYISSMQTHESILDLLFVGDQRYSFSSGRGLACSDKMLEILACVEPCEDKTIFELIPAIKAGIELFSGSILIFLGWDKGHQTIFQLFEHALVPVSVIVMTIEKAEMEKKIIRDVGSLQHIKVVKPGEILESLGAP